MHKKYCIILQMLPPRKGGMSSPRKTTLYTKTNKEGQEIQEEPLTDKVLASKNSLWVKYNTALNKNNKKENQKAKLIS